MDHQVFIHANIRIYMMHFLICRLLKREKRKTSTVVHMIRYVGFVFLVVSIHILFHQKNCRHLWGYIFL